MALDEAVPSPHEGLGDCGLIGVPVACAGPVTP